MMNLDKTQLELLNARFSKNQKRHEIISWEEVEERLRKNPAKLKIIQIMEETGGEPDVIGRDAASGMLIVADCSPETPAGRRSLCYDRAALDERKENKPTGSVLEMAKEIGVELMDEAAYRRLQELGQFDIKTSSWVLTPDSIRELGGAVFCDRRYNQVFLYHNGASSYYAARGFRGQILI